MGSSMSNYMPKKKKIYIHTFAWVENPVKNNEIIHDV